MKLEEKIEENIKDDIQKLGLEIEYVEYVKEGSEYTLKVVIDNTKEAVSINDCENVSRTIEDKVDSIMPKDKKYILEVSSAGLERQLKNIKLYKKYVNHLIHIKLYKKTDIGKEFDCMLKEADEKDNNIEIELNGKKLVLALSEIANAHTVFDYDKILKKKH